MSDIARFFDAAGYYRVPGRVSDDLVDRMIQRVTADFAEAVAPFRVNAEGKPARLDALLDRDPVFLEALRSDVARGPLTEILGPRVDVMKQRHNHSTLNTLGDIPFRLHRDVQQWSQPLLSIFFYLEESTVENGATVVVPASHRLPYAGPQSGGGGGNWADEHDEYAHLMEQALPIEMPRGGVLLLNSLTFHSVGRPRVATSRLSVVFACRSTDELLKKPSSEVVQIFGDSRFVGNEGLEVSGSLRMGMAT